MKKPNIDFSKQGMKKFLLYHIEKVILAVAIILLGVFFWIGFGTEKFAEQTPKSLADLSDRAHSTMVKPTSWTEIEEFRQADHSAHNRIGELEKAVIPVREYEFEFLLGTKAMTAGLRTDPAILPAEHLMAYTFPATVLVKKDSPTTDAVTDLPRADADDSADDQPRGGRGIGSGGAGLEGGENAPPEQDRPRRERDDGKIAPGSEILNFHRQEKVGIRPEKVNATPSNSKGWMCDVVAVTGLVRFEDQSAEFASAFAGAKGYYPKRDRPKYQYLQIERMAEGDPDWEDVSDKITNVQVSKYSGNTPEVVAPDYYDDVLTSPIPSMIHVDYRDVSTWPLYDGDFPDGFQAEEGFTGIPLRNVLDYPDGGLAAEGGEGPGENIEDPFAKKKKADEQASRGKSRRGAPPRPGDRDRGALSGGNRGRSDSSDAPAGRRAGSNFQIYEEAIESLDVRGPYRLVRFFDVIPVRAGADPAPKKYRYRVRLWLRDANNEPQGGFDKLEGDSRRGGDRGSGIGAGGGAGAGLEGGEGEFSGGKPGSNRKQEEEDTWVYVPVTELMKEPAVRERIEKDAKRKLPEGRDDLAYSIASDWSEPTDWVTVGKPANAEFYAGKIVPPKATRINDLYIDDGEAAVNIAAVKWDPLYGTRIPAHREARRADVLTFNTDAHVLHPVDWSVRKIENAEIDTDATVVDILGGEEVRGLSSAGSEIEYNMPGEVLVMASDGSLHVQNEIDDKKGFLHLLFQPDETAEIGGKKKAKKEDDEPSGRGGRGRGGDDPGF